AYPSRSNLSNAMGIELISVKDCSPGEPLLFIINSVPSSTSDFSRIHEWPAFVQTDGRLIMKLLLQEIRRNPLLWLLVFVPIALAAEKLNHEAHTLHFILSVLAMLPLAVLLSHATESVPAKTGDSVGGLLNATLGNLTELVIAIAALQAGQYTLKSRRVDCRPFEKYPALRWQRRTDSLAIL